MAVKYVLIFYYLILINCVSNDNWEQLMSAFKDFKVKIFLPDIQYIESIYKSTNISNECSISILNTMKALKNFETWSYQMYDSWSQFPPKGLLEGTLTDFGDYDQCLSIKLNKVIGRSQYCLIDISVPMPEPMPKHIRITNKVNVLPHFFNKNGNNIFETLSENAIHFYINSVKQGICAPTMCGLNDIEILVKNGIKNSGLKLESIECQTNNELKLNTIQILVIFIIFVIFIVSIFATILDTHYFRKRDSAKYKDIIEIFSLKVNIRKLLSTQSSDEFTCFDGIRVLSMALIVLGHSNLMSNLSALKNTFKLKEIFTYPLYMPISRFVYAVDTFFLMSGFLTSYKTMKSTKGNYDKFNKLSFIIQRYLRLTPLLLVVMSITTLLHLTNSGPIWTRQIQPEVDKCYKNWWINLLHMQNIIDPSNMCLLPTWFVACAMQYYWMSFVFIVLLLKNKIIGLIFNMILISLSFMITSILIYINDMPPGHVSTNISKYFITEFLPLIYIKPWSHGSVYFIGLYFGYILYKIKPKKISNFNRLIIWAFIAIGYAMNIFDNYYWSFGAPNNKLISAFLYPTARIIWALNTTAVIWMCISGNGGLVNRILSWKAFIPLSRLTYSVFLTHIFIVWYYWASKRDSQTLDFFSIVCYCIVILIISYLFGIAFSLIFESPITFIQNYIRNKFFMFELQKKVIDSAPERTYQIENNNITTT